MTLNDVNALSVRASIFHLPFCTLPADIPMALSVHHTFQVLSASIVELSASIVILSQIKFCSYSEEFLLFPGL